MIICLIWEHYFLSIKLYQLYDLVILSLLVVDSILGLTSAFDFCFVEYINGLGAIFFLEKNAHSFVKKIHVIYHKTYEFSTTNHKI